MEEQKHLKSVFGGRRRNWILGFRVGEKGNGIVGKVGTLFCLSLAKDKNGSESKLDEEGKAQREDIKNSKIQFHIILFLFLYI